MALSALSSRSENTLPQRIPRHVAIIMDGNGRWAMQRGMPRIAGHKKGADAARHTIEACAELGIAYLTVYAFSSENWNRPEQEVSELMELLRFYLGKELQSLHKQGVRLRFIGDRSRLADDIQKKLADAEALTEANTTLTMCVALSYGGRQEIVRAAQQIAREVRDGTLDPETLNDQLFERYLDTAGVPYPDLLIRTGGEERVSNFLLWQLAYAEFYFTDTLWPDFSAQTLREAVTEFSRRERRYGKINE